MMKLLKFAILVIVAMAAPGARGQEGGFDHERLTTVDGRTYHEVFVIGSDGNGLTFRHRNGIAKVGFGQLSEGYRMLYEGVAELPAVAPGGPSADPGAETAPEADWVESLDEGPVMLLARKPDRDRASRGLAVARRRGRSALAGAGVAGLVARSFPGSPDHPSAVSRTRGSRVSLHLRIAAVAGSLVRRDS